VGVSKDFGDRQNAARPERPKALSQSGSTIRYLAERRYEEDEIKAALVDVRLRCVTQDRGQIRDLRVSRARPDSIDHSGLYVDAYCFAFRLYSFRSRNEQSPWSGTDFKNPLPRLQVHAIQGRRSPAETIVKPRF
jgi:hypothetical protein